MRGSLAFAGKPIAFGGPLLFGLGREIGEAAGGDGGARACHQVLVIEEIDDRKKRAAERLAAAEQMMQISAGEIARGRAAALRIERTRILGVMRVLDVDRPEA